MNRYRVTVRGHNAWINLDDELTAVGFLVSRVVEASNPTDAQRKGLEIVANDVGPRVVPGTALGIRLMVESCEQLDVIEPIEPVASGFLWFPAEEPPQQ
jgi:hypothetical protein